jgi:lysophospholipase L1-like esterase
VVTLDLGANDLVTHLGSAECQLEPRGDACQSHIDAGLEGFSNAFSGILATLKGELDDGAELYIMTMYNPFDFGLGIPFEDFSNEIIAQLNEIITSSASQAGAKIADPSSGMAGNANAWTNMLQGDIHPNADGYQVLTLSLVEAK